MIRSHNTRFQQGVTKACIFCDLWVVYFRKIHRKEYAIIAVCIKHEACIVLLKNNGKREPFLLFLCRYNYVGQRRTGFCSHVFLIQLSKKRCFDMVMLDRRVLFQFSLFSHSYTILHHYECHAWPVSVLAILGQQKRFISKADECKGQNDMRLKNQGRALKTDT